MSDRRLRAAGGLALLTILCLALGVAAVGEVGNHVVGPSRQPFEGRRRHRQQRYCLYMPNDIIRGLDGVIHPTRRVSRGPR